MNAQIQYSCKATVIKLIALETLQPQAFGSLNRVETLDSSSNYYLLYVQYSTVRKHKNRYANTKTEQKHVQDTSIDDTKVSHYER